MMNEMTAEEAVEILKYERDNDIFVATEYREKLHEALTKAIKALEQQPSEDCISRQAVIDFIIDNYGVGFNSLTNGIRDYLPPVTPKRPKGKWIRVVDKAGHWVWECDCKWQQRFATNYCPDCGSYNGGDEDEVSD